MQLITTVIGIIIAVSIVSSIFPTLAVFATAESGDASDDSKGKPSDPNSRGEVIQEQATTDDGNPGQNRNDEDTTITQEEEDDDTTTRQGDDNDGDSTSTDTNDNTGQLETVSDNPNGNDDNVPGDNPQPSRVGSHDEQTSPNGA